MGRHEGSTRSWSAADEPTAKTVSFVHRLAASDAFKSLFKEGMTLVEEAAAYLDGPGRQESRLLRRPVALAYATESMRLTTRLMQVASWLLLQRAVNEGELTAAQALSEKHRVRLAEQDISCAAELFEELPAALRQFSLKSLAPASARRASRSVDGGGERTRPGAAALRGRLSVREASGGLRPLSGRAVASRRAAPRRGRAQGKPKGLRGRTFVGIGRQVSPRTEPTARNGRRFLLSPLSRHPAARGADLDGFAPRFAEALGAADVASALARVAPGAEGDAKRILQRLIELAAPRDVATLVESDARLAARVGADGAHIIGVGAELAEALASLHPERIVGAGGLRSRDDAMAAGEAGVDYVMFGEPRRDGFTPPLADTVERTAWWAEIFQTPCVAFAGALDAVAPLTAAGADFIALGDAVWLAPSPAAAIAQAQALVAKATV